MRNARKDFRLSWMLVDFGRFSFINVLVNRIYIFGFYRFVAFSHRHRVQEWSKHSILDVLELEGVEGVQLIGSRRSIWSTVLSEAIVEGSS